MDLNRFNKLLIGIPLSIFIFLFSFSFGKCSYKELGSSFCEQGYDEVDDAIIYNVDNHSNYDSKAFSKKTVLF